MYQLLYHVSMQKQPELHL